VGREGALRGWRGSVWGPGQAEPCFVAVHFTQEEVEFKEEIAAHQFIVSFE